MIPNNYLDNPRFIPVEPGQYQDIEAYPLIIFWYNGVGDPPPKHPDPPQKVRAIPYKGSERRAIDKDGWLYYRWGYPYGWATAGHISQVIGEAVNYALPVEKRWYYRG